MGYTFTCDICDTHHDTAPPFMGELRETFLKTADTPLADAYHPGQTVTICRTCSEDVLV